mmetsp:Transcript_549/g.887  ORF Transcript_549/g.887 Transcript_549/m.887 type:complete len:132 (+) Transcript_549:92-487(+)
MGDQMIYFIAQSRVTWLTSLLAEQREAVESLRAPYHAEETRDAKKAEHLAVFNECDANNDGLLDKAEFSVYLMKEHEKRTAHGVPVQSSPSDMTAEQMDGFYGALNAYNPDTEGISFEDFWTFGMKLDIAS